MILPVIDYPSTNSNLAAYDEQWLAVEIDLLVSYVEGGGLLVLTNSANRLFFGEIADTNEDWDKANPLAERFGVNFTGVPMHSARARLADAHPLTEGLTSLIMIANNGLPFSLQDGLILAEVDGEAALGLVDYGGSGGQVLILSDLGSFNLYDFREHERDNLPFMRNLARYAGER